MFRMAVFSSRPTSKKILHFRHPYMFDFPTTCMIDGMIGFVMRRQKFLF